MQARQTLDRTALRGPGFIAFVVLAVFGATTQALAQSPPPPLLLAAERDAIADAVDGDAALQTVEGLAQFHRQRGSRGYHSAAELIARRARDSGLANVEILRFPADGKIFYGTQRSRPGWDADRGELTETVDGRTITLASYAAMPVSLAQDSQSADVTAEVVDVGAGTAEADYAGKDVKGKLVLVTAQPGAVQDLAVGRFGAAGIVSAAQNQPTAWSGENLDQVRWGHLGTFSEHPTFAFMVSLRTAAALRARLATGEAVRLHASVEAGHHPSAYEVVTATIPGADPRLKDEEIAFSCHLDHQKPGANDNASGCATILEVARSLQALVARGALPRPKRTIRFVWPPEIEGTIALLNARPDLAARIKAVVHMDMVGGGPATQAVFHVTRGPASLPSPVHDVAWSFAQWANTQSYAYAATGKSARPMLAASGGKAPLRAEDSPFSQGSDHEVYQDSSFGIPAVYLNDWPDRYIHTNLDDVANIDATKLRRVAFIGAATGYALADARVPLQHASPALPDADGFAAREAGAADGDAAIVFRRKPGLRGPMTGFGYGWFDDKAKAAGLPRPALLDFAGERTDGGLYAYEALNFADGVRSVAGIRDALSAAYGDVSLPLVAEYLLALESIGVLERVR
jgi:aminopeptidase YwaD